MKTTIFHITDTFSRKSRGIDYVITITELMQEEIYNQKKRSNKDLDVKCLYDYPSYSSIKVIETNDFINDLNNKVTINAKYQEHKINVENQEEIKKFSDINHCLVNCLLSGLSYRSSQPPSTKYHAEILYLIYYALNRTENTICRKNFYASGRLDDQFDIWISENEDLSFNIIQIFIHSEKLKIKQYKSRIYMFELDELEDCAGFGEYLAVPSWLHRGLKNEPAEKWEKTNEIKFTTHYNNEIYVSEIENWIKSVCTEVVKNKLPRRMQEIILECIGRCINIGINKLIVDYLL